MSNEIYVKVGGAWKQANAYYVNVSGTWKTGSEFNIKVNSDWKGGAAAGGGFPTSTQILSLDFLDWSLPTIGNLDAKAAVDSKSLDILDWSVPVVGNPSS